MKQKTDSNTKQGHSTNMLLYAVAPQPKLSTDAIALEGAVVSRGNGIGATSETYLMDCIVGMKHYPDKYFDLAVVDPPYGIGASMGKTHSSHHSQKKYTKKDWDKEVPQMEYFTELFRVSKNQIIWGGNYFANLLPISRGWIYWDKDNYSQFSDGELAWTSFDVGLRAKRIIWNGFRKGGEETNRFHPTQKPIALYQWIYKTYTEQNFKILDTHLGSGSSRIAADKEQLNFIGFEIDEEYFYAQEMRFKEYKQQLNLFSK